MEKSIAELADRFTILKIKKANGMEVEDEISEILEVLPIIDRKLLSDLQKANQTIWNLEREVGVHAMESRVWNDERARIKEEINNKHGGFSDPKNYTT